MNRQYYDIVKSKLKNVGYNTSDLDAITTAIIQYADENKLNAVRLMEDGFDFNKLDSNVVGLINKFRYPTSFITRRVKERPTSKFVRRSIIE